LQNKEDERDETRRPTPVRAVMEGGSDSVSAPDDLTRTFHDDETGTDWSVNLTGWSASGILPLRTVPLVELTFSRAEGPEEPSRRVLWRGESLAGMSETELLEAFRSSEPFRPPMREAQPVDKGIGGGRNRRNARG
jgi:hypothetical protein